MERDEAEKLVDKIGNEQMALEHRVYVIEKELQLVTNILVLGCLIGGYLFLRWYQEHEIPFPTGQTT